MNASATRPLDTMQLPLEPASTGTGFTISATMPGERSAAALLIDFFGENAQGMEHERKIFDVDVSQKIRQ